MFKPIVFANAIQSMSFILHTAERMNINLGDENAEYNAYMFFQLLEDQTSNAYTLVEDVKVTPQLANIIAILWRDSGVKEAYEYANENHLSDCASYFLSNLMMGAAMRSKSSLGGRSADSGSLRYRLVVSIFGSFDWLSNFLILD